MSIPQNLLKKHYPDTIHIAPYDACIPLVGAVENILI